MRNYEGDGVRALVPSLIGCTAAAQGIEPHGDGRGFEELLELASSEFKSHVGSLEAWALAHGVAVDRTKKALRLITSSKRVMLWAFPNDNGMQLSLEPLRRARNNELADMVVDVCSRIAGKAAAPNYPGINAALAVARWDELVESILDPPAIA